MIKLKQIYSKITGCSNFLTESKKSHLKHLFEDGTLTFDDMRNIFKNVFTGKVGISDKINKIPLQITFKDGQFAIANDDNSIKSPYSTNLICNKCKCKSYAKDAINSTISNLIKAFSKFEQQDLNSIFANGQNYFSIDLIIPSEELLKDYGNRCFMQCNKVNSYDNTFKNVVEDEEGTQKITDKMKLHKSIIMNNPEINVDTIGKLKSSISPNDALKQILTKLESIVDGIGYKATVNDYVRERYAKYIVNCAMKKGIDLYHNSNFVNELIARLSYIADHRPNRADLITYAKRDGIDFRTDAYKEFIEALESSAEETNDAIIKPVEQLVLLAGKLLMKCFSGITAADPRSSVKRVCPEIQNTISTLGEDDSLTPEKIKILRHCMKSLDQYQTNIPKDGILLAYNGKIYKINAHFGAINQLMKLMNY